MPGIERKTEPPCPHEREHGEGTVWPDDVSLVHFDKCLTPDGRLFVWKGVRRLADQGAACQMQDHAGQMHSVHGMREHIATLRQVARTDQAYIGAMTEQLRELMSWLQTLQVPAEGGGLTDADSVWPSTVLERLEGILSTRAQSAEQVEP